MGKWVLCILLMFSAALRADDPVEVPDRITVGSASTLRSSSYFGRSRTNYIGTLNPGTQAEIIATNTNLRYGIGLQIRVLNGTHEGKIGWIYYHKNPAKRTIDLVNANGVITPEEEYARGTSDPASRLINEAFGSGRSSSEYRNRGSNLWKQVAKYPLNYTIDLEDYDGGEIVPINYRYRTTNGVPVHRRFYARVDTQDYFNLPENVRSSFEQARHQIQCNNLAADDQAPEQNPTPSSGWINGCEVLAGGLDQSERRQARNCLANIQAAILEGAADQNGFYSRTTVFKNLYKKLNEDEQRFAAMVFTSAGESGVLAPPLEELMSVMKVLDNRARYANERGFERANALDTALQYKQFSFYNRLRRAPQNEAWRRLLINADMREHPQIRNSIDAYIAYQSGASFSPERHADDIYHYYSTILDPPNASGSPPTWRRSSREVDFEINDRALDGKVRRGKRIKHRFYRNIAWSFSNNDFRSMAEEELDEERGE